MRINGAGNSQRRRGGRFTPSKSSSQEIMGAEIFADLYGIGADSVDDGRPELKSKSNAPASGRCGNGTSAAGAGEAGNIVDFMPFLHDGMAG
ncbi:MAG: hypothetical protein LBU32_15445 [Clostridiales bacterium]|jgi:hypothetical protein|nr:hypothetical protein [Clostridiales bacterium]